MLAAMLCVTTAVKSASCRENGRRSWLSRARGLGDLLDARTFESTLEKDLAGRIENALLDRSRETLGGRPKRTAARRAEPLLVMTAYLNSFSFIAIWPNPVLRGARAVSQFMHTWAACK